MGRIYRTIFDLAFVPMNPEVAHHLVYNGLAWAGAIPGFRTVVQHVLAPYLSGGFGSRAGAAYRPGMGNVASSKHPGSVETLGQHFAAPFGLAAGFDKDAGAVRGLTMLGFAFVEVGTITPEPQPGNPKPRLWRDVKNNALRNAMGFNNEGAQAAAARLAQLRCSPGGQQLKIGVNIGKNKWTTPEDAAQDYATCAKLLAPYADYLVVNVSSPNTPGLRDLQDVSQLREILLATRAAADQAISDLDANQHQVPLLVKIAPDLSDEDILAVAELVVELGIDGVVAVNTTIAHDEGAGGKSGPLLKERGLDVVKLLRIVLPRDVAIIGCGGISTAEDAREYLAAGANLVQGYTGFIYEGPFWASRINKALTR